MKLSEMLKIRPGVTAIIGGGGKTTLMFALADELKASGPVIVCTSTKIWRPKHVPILSGADEEALADALRRFTLICVGVDAEGGKLTSPACSFEKLALLARYVLVEADGSKGLPMKAHAPGEPVIPGIAGKTILVIGAKGFGRSIRDAAHRPELYAKLAGVGPDEIITPQHAAQVASTEGLHDCIFINQVESEADFRAATALQALVSCPVYAGSLHKGKWIDLLS